MIGAAGEQVVATTGEPFDVLVFLGDGNTVHAIWW
jgi:hypothetical protein